MSDLASVTHDEFTVSSNAESAEQIREALQQADATPEPETPPEPTPEAPPAEAAPVEPEKPKIDKRTREGRKQSIQEEIDALTATKHATRREVEATQAEIARLKAEREALAQPKQEPAKAEKAPTAAEWARYKAMPNAPKVDQFESYDDYTVALSLFIADQRYDERRTHDQQQAAFREMAQAHEARVTKFQEKVFPALQADPTISTKLDPDLVNAKPLSNLTRGDRVTFANVVAEQLLRCEHPLEVMLYLSDPTNREYVQRLSTLPPEDFFPEMGRLDMRVVAAPSGPAPTSAVSHAKPPIKPVGSSPASGDPYAITGDESVDEHIRKMNAADRRKRTAR